MRERVSTLAALCAAGALLAACLFAAGCTDEVAPPRPPVAPVSEVQDTAPAPCEVLCARITAAACPAQKPCAPACDKAIAEPTCGALYLRWATCAARQPATLFACDARGQGALDPSRCAEELLAFGDCLLGG